MTGLGPRVTSPHMRLWGLGIVWLCAGCSLSVSRLDGEVQTPAGPARTECEEEDWLVLAPTRSLLVSTEGTASEARRDSLGLYAVGGDRPKSITRLERQGLGPSPLLPPHREATAKYDRNRVMSLTFGGVGMVVMGVGAAVFASAFETVTVGGGNEEELQIDKGKGAAGAILMGIGLGWGIAGLALTPSISERTRAQSYRYTFTPENDPEEEVIALVAAHNEDVRAECARSGDDAPLAADAAAEGDPDDDEAPAEEAPAAGEEEDADDPDDADEAEPGLENEFDDESNDY
jgi:hypothetical protein